MKKREKLYSDNLIEAETTRNTKKIKLAKTYQTEYIEQEL